MALLINAATLRIAKNRIETQKEFLHLSLVFSDAEKLRVAEIYDELIDLYDAAILKYEAAEIEVIEPANV